MASLAVGLLAIGMSLQSILDSGTYYPKLLMVGVVALPIGLAMVACPGRYELPVLAFEPVPLGEVFAALTPFERIVWIAATVLGMAAGFYVVFAL